LRLAAEGSTMKLSTTIAEVIKATDVIEFDHQGERVTGLVLLVSDEHLIVDLCDDTTVLVTTITDLQDARVFRDQPIAA
jgi:hypothetical protein